MSTTSTSRAYLEKINQNFPVAGQDNDSQGFRDNFKNIKDALSETDISLENLKLSAVAVTNTSTDFNFNTIERVNIKNRSYTVVDRTTSNTYSSSAPINYTDGSYQKILLPSGNHTISIVNWPTSNKSGKLTLDVQTPGSGTINFSATGGGQLFKFGNSGFPVNIVNGIRYIFELWNVGSDLYVETLDNTLESNTATSYVKIKNNIYTVGSINDTVVTHGGKRGTIALVPNKVITTVTDDTVDSPTTPGSANLPVSSVENIEVGAKIVSTITNNVFTVVSTTTNAIGLTPAFVTDPTEFPNGSTVYFINPQFTDQSVVITLISEEPIDVTGGPTDLKGQIYANSSTLWVAYNDYNGEQNWFRTGNGTASTLDASSVVLDNSTGTAATTAFVHSILPYGSIIMWYGSVANVPAGWALCNGTNGTPDLRNSFVIGAGSTYNPNATGGSADSIVISHTHSASVSGTQTANHNHAITDPGHQHVSPTADGDAQSANAVFGADGTPTDRFSDSEGVSAAGWLTSNSTTNISLGSTDVTVNFSNASVTVATAGSAGTGANLPPYYALCYIMKKSGGA